MCVFTKNLKLTKRNAVIFLLIIAAISAAAVMLCASPGCGFGTSEIINLSSPEGRQKYLASYGWEIDLSSEEEQKVTLPDEFEGVIEDYATLQTEQGYDFASYKGLTCRQYNYIVTNYPDSDGTVYVTLFVKSGRIIGGDIHSAAIDGFMHAIK